VALLFLLGAFALWWAWPRQRSSPRKTANRLDQARGRLGVRAGADAAEIEASFRARVLIAHPDQGGTAQETLALTQARDLLLASLLHKGQ
jgi:hypothetical protein